ncbi:Adaptor protein complex AP-3 delta subunit [Ceratobasidium sp. AG-I]|nr:Adaptor protein complex AP-3 delta subunit [Ceratobasidium sp. AG-I]
MWERTLSDLIRGLRANKGDESQFIAKAVDEIRTEVKSKDIDLKAAAVLKLVYLDMLGYPMKWASFYVVEVMSSPKFHLKAVGYLAAVQSFTADTDVLMLTTNLLKKDLSNAVPSSLPLALNGFSHLATPDLARDLASDIFSLLTHTRASVRKSAVVALFRLLVAYPDATSVGVERLKEKLGDDDAGVVSATVNVLCELARRSPMDYLVLAPQLFHLLTTASNNWMLIKIVKLFGFLTPHEPRLTKKLSGPLSDLIANTPAISLLYECVHTVIVGGMLHGSMARACSAKLAVFLGDSDQNLKYIALLAMAKIAPTHAYLVAEHQDIIFSSIEDPDMSIRMRALELLTAMATRDNIQSIVQQLLDHLVKPPTSSQPSASSALRASLTSSTPTAAPKETRGQTGAYRTIVARRILHMLSRDAYSAVPDFEWALSVLVDLAYVLSPPSSISSASPSLTFPSQFGNPTTTTSRGTSAVGKELANLFRDISVRVRAVRSFAAELAARCVGDDVFWASGGGVVDVLGAAVWVCGEYASELESPLKTLLDLLQPAALVLPPPFSTLCVQSAIKVFGFWASEQAREGAWSGDEDRGKEVSREVKRTEDGLRAFVSGGRGDVEVLERATNALQLFRFIQADIGSFEAKRAGPSSTPAAEGEAPGDAEAASKAEADEPTYPKSMYLLQPLRTSFELNYVAPHAQTAVAIPDGLDLDRWIVPPNVQVRGRDETEGVVKRSKKGKEKGVSGTGKKGKKKKGEAEAVAETPEEKAAREKAKAERLERQKDDPYYISDKKSAQAEDVESIPIVKLEGMPPLSAGGTGVSPTPGFAGFRPRSAASRSLAVVDVAGEMPSPRSVSAAHTPPVLGTSPISGTPPGPAVAAPRPRTGVISSFPQYEVEDEERVTTPAPEAIKVTKVKKKKAGGKSKSKPSA